MNRLLTVQIAIVLSFGIRCAGADIPASEWVGADGVVHSANTMSLAIPKHGADVGDLLESLKTPLKLDAGVYTVSASVSGGQIWGVGDTEKVSNDVVFVG